MSRCSSVWPAARSVCASSRISAKASRNGCRSVIWLPMCMWMPAMLMPGSLRGLGVEARGVVEGHAELVLGLAGGDLGVRLGVDVRVDADGDARGRAHAGRHLAQRVQLGLGLDIEAADALAQRIGHLGARLADAGEDDLGRRHAGGPRAAQLALGDHVHAGAEPGQGGDHGLVGVGLQRVADQRVEPGEGLLQHPVVPLQRGRGIAIERGADRPRQCARGSRPPRGGRRHGSRNGAWGARQRISGSRMEGWCGLVRIGDRSGLGLAGLGDAFGRLQRAAHAAAGQAERAQGQKPRAPSQAAVGCAS